MIVVKHSHKDILLRCAGLVLLVGVVSYAAVSATGVRVGDYPGGNPEPGGVPRHSKAVYILPGICGSDLYAEDALSAAELLSRAPELAGYVDETYHTDKGESLWIPQNIHPFSAMAMLACDEQGVPLMPTTTESDPTTYGPLGIYQYLVLRLEARLGDTYDVRFFPYDWRLSSRTNAEALQASIAQSGYESVSLVAHSMGGLVASSYLAMSPDNRELVDRAVFVAVPFLGTPKALYAAETGNFFNMQIVRGMELQELSLAASHFRSVAELLPTREAFTYMESGYVEAGGQRLAGYEATMRQLASLGDCAVDLSFRPDAEAFHQSLILADGTHAAASVDSVFLCGVGKELIQTVSYDRHGALEGASFGGSGDATVPVWSASMGISATGSNEYGLDPTRVFYKNVSHFGFTLDADTASFIAAFVRDGDMPADTTGFSLDAAQATATEDASLARLTDQVQNGMFALYLRSFADRLAANIFR